MRMSGAWKRGGIALAALIAGLAATQAGSLKIESWRNDDADIWNNTIIPAFQKPHPDIKVVFSATQPAEYNAALNAKLEGGTAGDLITCRPFDASLELYQKHQLDGLNDLRAGKFPRCRQGRLVTDDGKTTFCVPMASVIHGFIYNKDAFKKIGAKPPKTMAEFHASSTSSRRMELIRHRHGHRRPVGGRDHGLPEHRPRLLEGRDGRARR